MIRVHDLYTARNFSIKEFVPKNIYRVFGERSRMFLNDKLFIIAQELRNDINKPIYVNNWHRGGTIHYRGYRPPFSKVGSLFSQHRIGQAIDVSTSVKHWLIYDTIMENEKKYYNLGVRRLENPEKTKGNHLGWVHIDLKNTKKDKIQMFNP